MDALAELLARVDAGELGDPLPVLAYVAGQAVELDEAELNGARRRALLLVAAGGDPHRELEVDDRAVKALAADLYTDDRREQLGRGIDALVLRVRELAERARGGPVPRGGRRSGVAPLLPRVARRGARRMTPAVQAAKRAGIDFTLHEYEGVELGDGDYAVGVAQALGLPPERLFKTLVASVDGRPLRLRRAGRPSARPARRRQAGDPCRPLRRRSARPAT